MTVFVPVYTSVHVNTSKQAGAPSRPQACSLSGPRGN
jgi:hypothetical protein